MFRALCIGVGLLTSFIVWWNIAVPRASVEYGLKRPRPKSCAEVVPRVSGVYSIQPEWPFRGAVLVYCDHEYDHGGWTVIQRRIDGTLAFDRPEQDYVTGFGSVEGEFWLGLDNIYRLLQSAPQELVVLLEDFSGNTSYAKYERFEMVKLGQYIVPRYRVRKCESYSGNAGDFLNKNKQIYYGEYYTTQGPEKYTVSYSPIEDPTFHEVKPQSAASGGFWIGTASNLNGIYILKENVDITYDQYIELYAPFLHWGDIELGAIKSTKMMLRPKIPKKQSHGISSTTEES